MESHLPPPDLLLSPDERLDRVNERIVLIQKKNGLTFGTDAFLLSAFAPAAGKGKRIAADLGSGTGIIPLLLLAKNKYQTVHAVELQPAFAELVGRNAAVNGFSDRLIPHSSDIRELSVNQLDGEMDAVFANPPYRKAGSGMSNTEDALRIARHEENGGIEDFCLAAARILKFGGKFFCVFRPDRLADLFCALRHAELEPKRMVLVHADEASEPSIVLMEARYKGAAELRVLPPLFLHTADSRGGTRSLTPRAQRIYDTCSFES